MTKVVFESDGELCLIFVWARNTLICLLHILRSGLSLQMSRFTALLSEQISCLELMRANVEQYERTPCVLQYFWLAIPGPQYLRSIEPLIPHKSLQASHIHAVPAACLHCPPVHMPFPSAGALSASPMTCPPTHLQSLWTGSSSLEVCVGEWVCCTGASFSSLSSELLYEGFDMVYDM